MGLLQVVDAPALDAEAGDEQERARESAGPDRGIAQNLELGSNADTGGQTKYVVELAEELGECPEVERVDLLTDEPVDANESDEFGWS